MTKLTKNLISLLWQLKAVSRRCIRLRCNLIAPFGISIKRKASLTLRETLIFPFFFFFSGYVFTVINLSLPSYFRNILTEIGFAFPDSFSFYRFISYFSAFVPWLLITFRLKKVFFLTSSQLFIERAQVFLTLTALFFFFLSNRLSLKAGISKRILRILFLRWFSFSFIPFGSNF